MSFESLFSFCRAILGSASDYCAHHAHCSVLIVKKPKAKADHWGWTLPFMVLFLFVQLLFKKIGVDKSWISTNNPWKLSSLVFGIFHVFVCTDLKVMDNGRDLNHAELRLNVSISHSWSLRGECMFLPAGLPARVHSEGHFGCSHKIWLTFFFACAE